MELPTRLVHGDARGSDHRDSITPSIAQGTNWAWDTGEQFAEVSSEPFSPMLYNRHGNPNHEQVARLVAELEGAERALVTASGMGAFTTAVLSLVSAGDHVVGQRSMYAGVSNAMLHLLPRLGVECTVVDQGDLDAFEAAMRPGTSLALLESPSNPRLQITDLRAVADLARERGVRTLIDNTFATPLNQRPIELGIDLVWHSGTKYLGGHSDLMAGIIAGDAHALEGMWRTAQVIGAVLAPFNAWLLLRGLRTLSLRVAQHNANGQAVAEALADHPAVARVNYPGLPDHPDHDVAARQMSGFGGVLSVELAGGYAAAAAFIDALRLFHRASSLGDVHSLVVHPAALWAKALTPDQLAEAGVLPGLVRLACGIEGSADLVADARRAADAVQTLSQVTTH